LQKRRTIVELGRVTGGLLAEMEAAARADKKEAAPVVASPTPTTPGRTATPGPAGISAVSLEHAVAVMAEAMRCPPGCGKYFQDAKKPPLGKRFLAKMGSGTAASAAVSAGAAVPLSATAIGVSHARRAYARYKAAQGHKSWIVVGNLDTVKLITQAGSRKRCIRPSSMPGPAGTLFERATGRARDPAPPEHE
jgi:hypothetical protein